jgi:ATP-binding cassette subfamily F protein uup
LVSHDRAFLDHAVTSTLVFEGGGRVGEYVGGYSDWLRYQQNALGPMPEPSPRASTSAPAATPSAEKRGAKSKKLSFKTQRELNDLPKQIESLETEQAQLHATISEAAFYQQPGEAVTATLARLDKVTKELAACYDRWEALEEQATARD